MLSGAPPMLVVGLVLQALWVPLAVVMRATNTRLGLDAFALSLVLFFVGNFMVMVGALELARRSRGRARDGAALAVVADAIVLVIGVLATLKQGGWMPGDRHWVLDLGQWGAPLAALVGILGFAIASNAVVIPLFVLASREVANDPVKTTADVFA